MVIRLILGDQLNSNHSWFTAPNQEHYLYVLMEVKQETDVIQQHFKKITTFFAAMRSFHKNLQAQGYTSFYLKINEATNKQSFAENLKLLVSEYHATEVQYQFPDDYRLYLEFKKLSEILGVKVTPYESEHFFCSLKELVELGKSQTNFLMENFYRFLRRKFGVLMVQNKPLAGKWNFDADNRKRWNGDPKIPKALCFANDVSEVVSDLNEAGIQTFGAQSLASDFPINREQALQQLQYFVENLLPNFGSFQDAMHTDETLLFHSNLSFALNAKLVAPHEVVHSVEDYFYHHSDKISISQAEGFIRQILGWREYVRMVYWNRYDEIKTGNFFNHTQPLPAVFWTGKSAMNCVSHCATDSLKNAYAHHIQRLMVLGNFALLTETHPDETDAWYLGVYADALEWVQLPNTRCMSQFADGGILGTKPYVSTANYIDKMSNYCTNCNYDKKTKYNSDSCPFNSLYWYFLHKNRAKLQSNIRMKMMYALVDKFSPMELERIIERAEYLLLNRNF